MKSGKAILQLMDEFLANHDVTEISRKKYRDNLHVFIWWLTRNANPKDVKRSDIIRYKTYLIEQGKKAQTIDNYLAAVRQFYKYLEDNGECDNVAAGIRSPKRSKEFRKDHLVPEQVVRLLSVIDRSNIIGLRDYAIINLMVRTGLRCIEVSRMNAADLTNEGSEWLIRIQGKGRHDKDRVIRITNKIAKPILDYLEKRDIDDNSKPLFVNHAHQFRYLNNRITTMTISRMVKGYMRRIKIDSPLLTAHSLRHTAAVSMLQAGASIYDVQVVLGHSDVKTTGIYLLSIAEDQARKGTPIRLLDEVYENSQKTGKNGQKTYKMAM